MKDIETNIYVHALWRYFKIFLWTVTAFWYIFCLKPDHNILSVSAKKKWGNWIRDASIFTYCFCQVFSFDCQKSCFSLERPQTFFYNLKIDNTINLYPISISIREKCFLNYKTFAGRQRQYLLIYSVSLWENFTKNITADHLVVNYLKIIWNYFKTKVRLGF